MREPKRQPLSQPASRIKKLQRLLPAHTAVLLGSPGDIRYFTGFDYLVPAEREALLLVTPDTATLLHASFSPVANPDGSYINLAGCYPEKLQEQVLEAVKAGVKTLLVDEEAVFVAEYEPLTRITKLELKTLNRDLVWQLRSVKTAPEIAAMKKAAAITSQAFAIVQPKIAAGITELELKNLIDQTTRDLGSGPPAFPTIVAFGPHGALPHHQPTDTKLEENTAVLVDFGATWQNYSADMTRTFWFGSQTPEKFRDIRDTVHQAYEVAMTALVGVYSDSGNGTTSRKIDKASREVIAAAGYGSNFIHTTGHGLGLDIHEQPSLSWHNDQPLKRGMVVTIEPGIYLPGLYGYRHENTVYLGKNAPEVLTTKD